MEIYLKDGDGKLQETTLNHLLEKAFEKAGYKMDNGGWKDENYNWLGIIQENKKNEQVTTNILFENDGNTIIGLKIYVAPIKKIIDNDNGWQVV